MDSLVYVIEEYQPYDSPIEHFRGTKKECFEWVKLRRIPDKKAIKLGGSTLFLHDLFVGIECSYAEERYILYGE